MADCKGNINTLISSTQENSGHRLGKHSALLHCCDKLIDSSINTRHPVSEKFITSIAALKDATAFSIPPNSARALPRPR